MSELIQGRYVIGMAWTTLVAVKPDGLPKAAKQWASKQKANWFAQYGSETSVGAATLGRKDKPAKGEYFYAGARIVAQLNAFGPQFYALNLPADSPHAGKVWICGVINGSPSSRFDEIVSEVEAPQRFEEWLASSGVSVDEAGINGDASGMPPSINPMSWDDAMRVVGDGAAVRLQPTAGSFFDKLTPQQRAGGFLLLVAVAAWYGWGEYRKYRTRQERLKQAAMAMDPVVEWGNALRKWAGARRAPSGEPLLVLRRAMALVPSEVAGWDLQRMQCSMAQTGWTCIGIFDRTRNVAFDPTTGDFLAKRPQEWRVTPKSLDQLEVNFQVPLAQPGFDFSKAQDTTWHMQNTATALQKGFRAFSSVQLGAFTAAQLDPPRKPDGTALEQPPNFQKPMVASLSMQGPMRSIDLEEIGSLPVTWNTASITLNRGGDQPSIVSSAVMIEAKGEIYAKQ